MVDYARRAGKLAAGLIEFTIKFFSFFRLISLFTLKLFCSASGCQSHAATCGAGTGVFLLIRVWLSDNCSTKFLAVVPNRYIDIDSLSLLCQKTTILLQRSARQALWPSLYLDAFGEEVDYFSTVSEHGILLKKMRHSSSCVDS